jgi:formiminotetrahydrofolate cyclodeaminase
MSILDKSVNNFISELASNAPVPGGGSVAGLHVSTGFALLSMVAEVSLKSKTIEKPENAKKKEVMLTLREKSSAMLNLSKSLIDKDIEAFAVLSDNFKYMKSENPDEQSKYQDAIKQATIPPYELTKLAYDGLQLAKEAMGYTGKLIISDIGVANLSLLAGLKAARYNVMINLNLSNNTRFRTEVGESVDIIAHEAAIVSADIEKHIEKILFVDYEKTGVIR